MSNSNIKSTRTVLDLNLEELQGIVDTGTYPEGVNFKGLEDNKNFEVLFKHRNSPKLLAKTLLKAKQVNLPAPLDTLKIQRLELQKETLALKKTKANLHTIQFKTIEKFLRILDQKLNLVLDKLEGFSPEDK